MPTMTVTNLLGQGVKIAVIAQSLSSPLLLCNLASISKSPCDSAQKTYVQLLLLIRCPIALPGVSIVDRSHCSTRLFLMHGLIAELLKSLLLLLSRYLSFIVHAFVQFLAVLSGYPIIQAFTEEHFMSSSLAKFLMRYFLINGLTSVPNKIQMMP